VTLDHLYCRGFRNLVDQDLAIPSGPTLILGPNGSGKSSLLEAIAVLGNLRSFRTSRLSPLIQRGACSFLLQARLHRGSSTIELRHEVRSQGRIFRLLHRGARRVDPAEYLLALPVAVFAHDDRLLVTGPPEERRRFMDRQAFFLHRQTVDLLQRYRAALHQRNHLLQHPGNDRQLESFEHELAVSGAQIVQARQEALRLVSEALPIELEHLGWHLSLPVLRYHAPDGLAGAEGASLATRMRTNLERSRARDRLRGVTAAGPHRHDLAIHLHGAEAQTAISTGQAKLLATALKLAATSVLQSKGTEVPLVVFDDVDAELDAEVLTALLRRLTTFQQVLLSSAHSDMIESRLAGAAVWRLESGTVSTPLSRGGSTE
jgi:DNA replication and repair protein RecF